MPRWELRRTVPLGVLIGADFAMVLVDVHRLRLMVLLSPSLVKKTNLELERTRGIRLFN